MSLRLDNFEEVVEPIIVKRGKSYFRSGAIINFTEDAGEVHAVVQGSERYKVSMEIDADGEIHGHSCTCPYDWGAVCKHEVAVLYYLREKRKEKAVKGKKPVTGSATTDGASYDPQFMPRAAGHHLSEEKFDTLPKEEFDKHVLFLFLFHNGMVENGYLARIAKTAQLTTREAVQRKEHLVINRFLGIGDFYNAYDLNPNCVLPLAVYVFDRHPEWLAAEIANTRRMKGEDKAFWDTFAGLYDGNIDFIRTQRKAIHWYKYGPECLIPAFFDPFYAPLLYTLDTDGLRTAAIKALDVLLLGESLEENTLQHIRQMVDKYSNNEHPSDTSFDEYWAFHRYLITGTLPMPAEQATEWFYIAHAISAMHLNDLRKAEKLFETALKIRNKKSADKNLFYHPVANYFLMLFYALRNTPETSKKVCQFLRKPVAEQELQLPSVIVARYVALNEDDGHLVSSIQRLRQSGYPLLRSFAKLFADYFQVEIEEVPPTNIRLLRNEPLLFSITIQPKWEKTLDELLDGMPESLKEEETKTPQKEERLVYTITPFGNDREIMPQKQKRNKNGSWSKPYNVSAHTYFTTGYDFMDDTDRRIFERLRKIVGHTKYYYRPYWGTLPDYLPYLADTDKVIYYDIQTESYQPVSVRKERAFLSIEHKGKKLVFASNVRLNPHELTPSSPCVVEETPTSYLVIELTPYEQKVYTALLRMKSMPAEAEDKLKQFISAVSNRIEIHSDMIEGGSMLEKRAGDTTILIRLTPSHGDFTLECAVQPLQGGRLRFFPGEGKTTVYDEKEGTRYQVERNISQELQNMHTLCDFAENQLNILLSTEPQTISMEDVLRIMEFVSSQQTESGSSYAIEWLDGAKLHIRKPATETYSMGLRTRENWFEVEGDLPLDEQTILSAAELLRLMQEGMVGKRFIRLNETEFIALNEHLAKQLSRVQQLSQINRNNVVIPRLEIGLLGELLSRPDTILRGDKGVRELLDKIEHAAQMVIPVPSTLQATLRDYQEEGFRWMMRLAEWGAGACLADDMGLGKTVQTIAVMLARAAQGPSLVVAPASVLYNWQSELQRFAPSLNVHICNDAPDRSELIDSMQPYDVLLTTYGLLVREQKTLTSRRWNIICLDEAHTIKNRQTKMSQAAMTLQSDVRIALTGTPLQNSLSELWNLFRFLNPGLLGTFDAFSQDFITPIETAHNKQRQITLRKILQPFLLRRTKAEVIDELPEKTEITRRIILSPEERVAYEALRIEAQQQVEHAQKVDMNVLASITRLRQAACSLELVRNGASLSDTGGSKLEDFTELLTQIISTGNRVLVFSQFTSFLKMAQQALNSQLSTLYLDGSTPLAKRKQMVDAFQHGEAQVFFISLKAGGLGLNLTNANYVIHLDPWWNPAIEQQATDRAYRIGQKNNVTVYHLIAADTIEEKILRLHKTKRDLADALLHDQHTARSLTLTDLQLLLSTRND